MLFRSVRTYRDVFGFASDADAAGASTAATRALTGLTGAIVTRARVRAPGSAMWIELAEYSGVDRTPLRMKIQDRGAARLQLRAEQIDALVRRVAAAGLTIVTPGGAAVPIPPNFKGALVADPDNFFLTLFEACSDCAPFTRPAGAAAPAPAAH